MRVLVLDDDDTRHKTFAQNLIGNIVVHVRTYDEFEEALEGEAFDVVYLDHDLNMYQYRSLDYSDYGYAGARELTGQDCARLLLKLPEAKQPHLIVIHSFNPEGAKAIRSILLGARGRVVQELFCASSGTGLQVESNR